MTNNQLTEAELTETLDAATSGYPLTASAEANLRRVFAELQERRKAAMDSEPVAYIIQDRYEREGGVEGHLSRSHVSKYVSQEDINEHEIICTPLFKAPSLTHSIPDEWTFQNTQRYREDTGRQDAWPAMWGWNACLASMRQAGNSPVIPDTWIPVSERNPDDIGRYWCYVEDQKSHGEYSYHWNCSWNGSYWSGAMMHGRVTHWMPLPAAPQEVMSARVHPARNK